VIDTANTVSPEPVIQNRKMMLSLALYAVLALGLCAMGLYAFMIKVDMEEQKGMLIRNADDRQKMDAYLAQARNELAAARHEVDALRAQLNTQALGDQMQESMKPDLPLDVSFRRSFWGRGLVAKIRNKSARSLTVILAIRNPTLSKSNRFELKIGPDDAEEFSYSEGWEFASGDELNIYHNDFKGMKIIVP
jgi:hypothetical protein